MYSHPFSVSEGCLPCLAFLFRGNGPSWKRGLFWRCGKRRWGRCTERGSPLGGTFGRPSAVARWGAGAVIGVALGCALAGALRGGIQDGGCTVLGRDDNDVGFVQQPGNPSSPAFPCSRLRFALTLLFLQSPMISSTGMAPMEA